MFTLDDKDEMVVRTTEERRAFAEILKVELEQRS